MTAAVSTAAAATAPALLAPAPYEVSFGRIDARLPPGTVRLEVVVDGHRKATVAARPGRRTVRVALPSRDVRVRVVTVDAAGHRHSSPPIGPVFGLPTGAAPRWTNGRVDGRLQRRVGSLVRAFPGTAAAYVQSLTSGLGASWNARARFPAASSVKLAIAVATLRSLRGPPTPGSYVGGLLRSMIVYSDNRAANSLEVLIGGSTSGGAAHVDELMRSLGLVDTEMYGGYEIEARSPARIPIQIDSQPSFGYGKYTTAADLGRLLRDVYLAAGGIGPLVKHPGGLSPAEARYLLDLLVHVVDHGKLDRFLPRATTVAHKAGWISTARHDNGIVFWPGGAILVTVMTWQPGGAGLSSDVLAGRIAGEALARFEKPPKRTGPGRACATLGPCLP